MGYQITWKTKDILEDVKSNYSTNFKDKNRLKDSISEVRKDFIITCMRANKESSLNLLDIKYKFNTLKNLYKDLWVFDLYERLEEDELWFCGWEYSREDNDSDYIETLLENILLYSYCSKDSDPISDADYFFEKYDKITEEIAGIEDCVYDYMNHKFVDTYRDKQIKDNEDEEIS